MKIRSILPVLLALTPASLTGQSPAMAGLDPAAIRRPLTESWPVYSGDYTGRRFSALKQIHQATVNKLTLAWVARLTAATGAGPDPAERADIALTGPPTIVGGVGTGEFAAAGAPTIKGSILMVNGVLYVTAPDNVWALDAEDGHVLWQYYWKTRGGTHIANRGAALRYNTLFFETPDDYLVAIDATTGTEKWHAEIADFGQQYFSTTAPIVVDNHVLVGTGNDLDAPGFLQSYDPDTGTLQWKLYLVPMNAGDPGLETWPKLDAARHGGGHPWLPGSYDPESRLYIVGTGNPTPAYTGVARQGDNLFTCSLVAVNVDTGKMAWYFQTSAHDTHDWDSAQTPILIDGVINGKPRKLVSTAARNGYFYTLDRVTGEHLVTSKYGSYANWAQEMRASGVISPDHGKEATVPGSLVSPVESGVTNWPPAAFSPDTSLFYVQEHNGFNMLYLTDPDPRGSMGLGGKSVFGLGSLGDFLTAIDYRTGHVAWRHRFPGGGGGGLLATAGRLVFSGDGSGNFAAFDGGNGKPLWHTRIGNITNAPETYLVGGRQQLLVAVGDTLYAFMLP
jgi:alcohol dehydrogenase (cytochrome c)